ncbi:MAG: Crp/Fnr family transcriptional regulator [Hyphomicrobiaceae bacterium]
MAKLQLRRGNHLTMERLGAGEVLRVERGCLALQAPHAEGGSRIALLLFPGDVISRDAVPPIGATGLVAAVPTVIQRVGEADADEANAGSPMACAFARLAARTVMHALMLRELNAEQRLATFLLELVHRIGHATPAGCAFEVPLSRTDTAHYLALNPDTMSRLMSRLKAQNIVLTPSRGWVTVPSVAELAALTPMAGAIRELWPSAECGALLDMRPAAAL